MQSKYMLSILFVVFLLLPIVSQAGGGLYIGVEGGYTDIALDELDDDVSMKANVGYMFFDYLGVEVSYGSLGSFENSKANAESSVDVEQVAHAVLVFSGPLSYEWIEVYTKLGAYQAEVEPNIPNGTATDSTEVGFTYAAGVAFKVIGNLSATFSWQYYNQIEEVDFHNYSLGAQFSF